MSGTNRRPQHLTREQAAWYERCPKSVLLEIALYLGLRISGNESFPMAWTIVHDEWIALWQNGIVPQRPPSLVLLDSSFSAEES